MSGANADIVGRGYGVPPVAFRQVVEAVGRSAGQMMVGMTVWEYKLVAPLVASGKYKIKLAAVAPAPK